MAQITVDNKIINNEINPNSTVNDLIDEVLLNQKESIVSHIVLDGKVVSIDGSNQEFESSVGKYGNIEITTQNNLELAFDAINCCGDYVDLIITHIHQLTTYYNENKTEDANRKFGEVIEIMDLFIQLVSNIHKTLKRNFDKELKKSQTIQQLEIHLLGVLKALIPAKEKNDIIMLCDLLEYELVDNLTQWKIKALPELKNLKEA